MRRGKAADSRGAPKFVAEVLATAPEAGCTGLRILRADSQFYNAGVIAACRRAGARFSITTGMNPSIKRAIAAIDHTAWQQITYPTAVPDPETGELISDAEVAEIPAYTAFASRKKAGRVTARLIVRRVRDLAKPPTVGEQGELFPVWRYHPFLTDNPAPPSRQSGNTATTRWSSRSSPTAKPPPWPTCPRHTSTPTPPGSPCGRWPTTCYGPPAH
ncbi:transposase IS4 family protein [Streptomyces iranensis]|nr:transposase IS4 family protein [Streptomyces iranensis]